jgi:hypothetical protein
VETPGKRPRGAALMHWYTGRMHERCAHDMTLAHTFYRVMHMLEGPSALFRPSIVARVLCGPRRRTDEGSDHMVTEAPPASVPTPGRACPS